MRRSRCQNTTRSQAGVPEAVRRGVALMSTLVLMAVLAVSMAVSAKYLCFAKGILRREWEKKQAFYLAESGLAQGIAGLLQGQPLNAGSARTPLGNGFYWVEVKREPGRPNAYRILSAGQVGDERTGPVAKLCVIARVEPLFSGASRRVEILSWQRQDAPGVAEGETAGPAATQPGAPATQRGSASTRPGSASPF